MNRHQTENEQSISSTLRDLLVGKQNQQISTNAKIAKDQQMMVGNIEIMGWSGAGDFLT